MTTFDPRSPDISIWLNPGRSRNLAFVFPEGVLGDYDLTFYFGEEVVVPVIDGDKYIIPITLDMVDQVQGRTPYEWRLEDATEGILWQGEFYKARGNRINNDDIVLPLALGDMIMQLELVGRPGPKGDPGDAEGIPGPPGDPGEPGADGDDGRTPELSVVAGFIAWRYVGDVDWIPIIAVADLEGADGAPGAPGTDGEDGAPGAPGAPGTDGEDGADGREIELGTSATHIRWRYVGDLGWTNLVTLASLKGDPGDPGTDGEDGAPGAPGASAYEIAVLEGFVGTIEEWLASLQGEDGADGAPGAPGDDGADGAPGADGADGEPGRLTYVWDVGTSAFVENPAARLFITPDDTIDPYDEGFTPEAGDDWVWPV